MNTQKTVFNKLAKITKSESELEFFVEEVELASIKELDKIADDVMNEADDITKQIVKIEKEISLLKSMMGGGQSSSKLLNSISEIKKQADKLGVSIDISKYQNTLKWYAKTVQNAEGYIR